MEVVFEIFKLGYFGCAGAKQSLKPAIQSAALGRQKGTGMDGISSISNVARASWSFIGWVRVQRLLQVAVGTEEPNRAMDI